MDSPESALFRPAAGGKVRLAVKLTPKAAADRIQGMIAGEDGQKLLKVAVTAVPEDGKANRALIALLAKQWKLPKSAITIEAGAGERRKLLLIEADPAILAARLIEKGRPA